MTHHEHVDLKFLLPEGDSFHNSRSSCDGDGCESPGKEEKHQLNICVIMAIVDHDATKLLQVLKEFIIRLGNT